METGPNASTSCGSARSGSATSRIGETNAPRSASASTTSTFSGSPNAIRPASARALTLRRTSSRCSRLASAPIRTPSAAGLPTVVLASRADAASTTASRCCAGTNARRIAVHFCPALTVISATRPLTYRSNSGVPGAASGPRIDRFSESASPVNRTLRATRSGCVRSFAAVDAEPVNPTLSCSVRWSNRSPRPPATNCTEPAGSRPESTISSTSFAVEERGRAGRLDQRRDAGQERRRQLLQRTPDREVERVDLHRDAVQRGADVLADEGAAAAERLEAAVDVDRVVGQLAAALRRVGQQHAEAAVDVELRVAEGGAGPRARPRRAPRGARAGAARAP